MSNSIQRVPKCCRQRDKVRGARAFIRMNGKKYQLGRFGSPESRERYAEPTINARFRALRREFCRSVSFVR